MSARQHWNARKVAPGLTPGAQLTALNTELVRISHALRYSLSDLDDVTVATVADDNFLVYNSTTAQWENTALTAALLPTHDIVSKHTAAGLMAGHFLKATAATTFGFAAITAAEVTAGTFPSGAFAFTTSVGVGTDPSTLPGFGDSPIRFFKYSADLTDGAVLSTRGPSDFLGGAVRLTRGPTNAPHFVLRYTGSTGTLAVPKYPTNGDSLGRLSFQPFDEATNNYSSAYAFVDVVAQQTHTATKKGAALRFITVANDSVMPALAWQMAHNGHFLAGTDNTYDIGAAGATRPRTGYFGTSVIAPLFQGTTLQSGAAADLLLQYNTTTKVTIGTDKVTYVDGQVYRSRVVTGTDSVVATDLLVVCNSVGAFTLTMPTAVVGQLFHIKNIGAGTVTLEGASSDTIDGDLNQLLYQWDGVVIQCQAANTWVVV